MNTSDRVKSLWWAGVHAVQGRGSVQACVLNNNIAKPDMIIAVGKAAEDMTLGAMDVFGTAIPTLIATKYDHTTGDWGKLPNVTIQEAAHPVPDQSSLKAGRLVLERLQNAPAGGHVLCLLSGGASAIAEHLNADVDLPALIALNETALAEGLSIGQINERRRSMSALKGGRALEKFMGGAVTVIGISDVEGDAFSVIGSGLFDARLCNNAQSFLAGSNAVARGAAVAQAHASGLNVVVDDETLYRDVTDAAHMISEQLLNGPKGVYIWGGEPTVVLPKNPGKGGRNQALALEVAQRIKGQDGITCLVAGTDGTDGPTTAAGGIITGHTVSDFKSAQDALDRADSFTYLQDQKALFTTGPTGTNVMDLVVAIKD